MIEVGQKITIGEYEIEKLDHEYCVYNVIKNAEEICAIFHLPNETPEIRFDKSYQNNYTLVLQYDWPVDHVTDGEMNVLTEAIQALDEYLGDK